MCRSRRELSNAYFLAKFGFDTAENEPCPVCPPVHDARSRPVAPRWDHLEHHRDGSYYHGTGVFADLLFDKKSPPPEGVTDSGREAAAVV